MQKPSKFIMSSTVFIALCAAAMFTQQWLLLGIFTAVYVGIFMTGCARIGWNFFFTSQNELPESTIPSIALTFDDGPTPHSAVILDILKQHDVKATFFLVGQRVEALPQIARQMIAQGHVIGNHSHTHHHFIHTKRTADLANELTQCNECILQHTQHQTTLFRPPHGVTTQHLALALKRTHLRSIGWSIRSFDTASTDDEALFRRLAKQLQDRAIILMHDHCPITARVLPRFIAHARQLGYQFVTIA